MGSETNTAHPRWGLAALRRREQNKPICRIDLWGFVSVMLALVIMYMSRTYGPDLPRGAVDLIRTHHPTLMPSALREDSIQIKVQRNGDIYFGYLRVSLNELPDLIRDGVRNGAEKKVYISADARAKYQTVKKVLNRVRLSGVENACFLSESFEP